MHIPIPSKTLGSMNYQLRGGALRRQARGFALIATISVMVLLVMIALAMLSLSAIEMRASRNGDAKAEAKANARLAMMFALGELQKQAGPDQRVTAPGGIVAENAAHPHVAGVWESWRPDPFSPPSDYDTTKESKFGRWLVSHLDYNVVGQTSFADSGSFKNPVELLGEGTLGDTALPRDYVIAGKIPLTPSTPAKAGNMAWVIMDEGAKARVNLPLVKNTGSLAETSSNLGAASRAALEKVEPKYDPANGEPEKFVTLPATELGTKTDMGKYTHDLTTWSQGPLTNVVDGGLREDLNLMTDGTALPKEFFGKRVYSGTANGIAGSDPYWQQIFDYASVYKRVRNVGGLPEIDATVPTGYMPIKWDPSKGGYVAVKDSPQGAVLMPVVAKVQVVFSLVARRAHGGWRGQIRNKTGDSQRAFMLHMIYSPVVTLYNPYNVAMKFDKMRLDFQNVPIAFNFYRNGQLQNTKLNPLNNLYVWYQNSPNVAKAFTMTLQGKGASGTPGGPITLRPGEVRVFSPYLPPNHSWAADRPGDGNTYFDWRNDKTRNITAIPGWQGEGVGFDIDWLTPTSSLTSYDDDTLGVLSLRWADTVKVDYAPFAPNAAKNRMAIIATLHKGTSQIRSGIIEMDYGSTQNLQDKLPAPTGKRYTYPQPGEPDVTCGHIYESDGRLIRDYENVRSFCMFSAYGKTAFGGTSGFADGRYATKPWSFSNMASSVSSADLVNGHGSHHSHELNFETMPGHAENQVQVDGDDRGNFITGHTAIHGLKFGTHNEVPIAPIQSVASLQNANLCSSGYLPKFDYPVANSFAHPLMPAGSVRDGDKLDHSYLLNHYLYDRFYCSAVGSYDGAMFGNKKRATQKVFEDFVKGEQPLLDRRFVAWMPEGVTTANAVSNVMSKTAGKEGYRQVAAYQMLQGEWNVNSVSKEAWKAVLAGLHQTDFPLYDALTNTLTTRTYAKTPMSRYRLPNGKAAGQTSDPVLGRRQRWTGYRELEDDELDELAEMIVEEVRERGPFLSLTEFVNRRLSGSTEMQLSGALQAAIDRTKINDDMGPDGWIITKNDVDKYDFENMDAAIGHSSQGAPGSVTQGHIMNALGNAATVRSNTFTIRAYGESVDAQGVVQARAWCEAVVQRIPDYLDTADESHIKPLNLASEVNKNFGRRIRMVSFRWLGPEEV